MAKLGQNRIDWKIPLFNLSFHMHIYQILEILYFSYHTYIALMSFSPSQNEVNEHVLVDELGDVPVEDVLRALLHYSTDPRRGSVPDVG